MKKIKKLNLKKTAIASINMLYSIKGGTVTTRPNTIGCPLPTEESQKVTDCGETITCEGCPPPPE